jgi:uncharacterized protein (TIGR02246 family)
MLVPFALLLLLVVPPELNASNAEAQIKTVLNTQLDAWNRGDIPTFVTTYASDCIFVGNDIARGRDQLLSHYEKKYPNRDAMGHLSFSALEVHLVTADVAIVTGKWHIDRSGVEPKRVGGLFSLVFHRQAQAWKIALDHSS